ncbi:MAG: hypothetical protein KTR25_05640 [Myxococcales bacterium]|nr:hypothetical protein [Myxococcales bacterium]
MLDSYIIDAIKQAERNRREVERARLEIPLDYPADVAIRPEPEEVERGVYIVPWAPGLPLREESHL